MDAVREAAVEWHRAREAFIGADIGGNKTTREIIRLGLAECNLRAAVKAMLARQELATDPLP